MQTHIDLEFGDGVYTFRLGMQQLVAIEAKCGPIGEVYARVWKGRYGLGDQIVGDPQAAGYAISDLIETVRQGLIGGGQGLVDGQKVEVNSLTVARLIDTYAKPPALPLSQLWNVAASILYACIEGYEPVDEAQKKSSTTSAKAKAVPSA